MSIPPNSVITDETRLRFAAAVLMSACKKRADPPFFEMLSIILSPFSLFRPLRATLAPSSARSSVIALPIPPVAPVIRATFPSIFPIVTFIYYLIEMLRIQDTKIRFYNNSTLQLPTSNLQLPISNFQLLASSLQFPNLLSKNLLLIFKGFKFQGITAWIQKKHGGLFSRLAFKPDIGFDYKIYLLRFQSLSQLFPLIPFQNESEMLGRNLMPVNFIGT